MDNDREAAADRAHLDADDAEYEAELARRSLGVLRAFIERVERYGDGKDVAEALASKNAEDLRNHVKTHAESARREAESATKNSLVANNADAAEARFRATRAAEQATAYEAVCRSDDLSVLLARKATAEDAQRAKRQVFYAAVADNIFLHPVA